MRTQSNTQLSAEISLDMRPPHTTNWVRKSHEVQEIGRRAKKIMADLVHLIPLLQKHS